jgi:hypothetical protein
VAQYQWFFKNLSTNIAAEGGVIRTQILKEPLILEHKNNNKQYLVVNVFEIRPHQYFALLFHKIQISIKRFLQIAQRPKR